MELNVKKCSIESGRTQTQTGQADLLERKDFEDASIILGETLFKFWSK